MRKNYCALHNVYLQIGIGALQINLLPQNKDFPIRWPVCQERSKNSEERMAGSLQGEEGKEGWLRKERQRV